MDIACSYVPSFPRVLLTLLFPLHVFACAAWVEEKARKEVGNASETWALYSKGDLKPLHS